MKLSKYLQNKNVPEFARKIGVCRAAVNHWLTGIREPRPDQARKIVAETGGKVTLQDIYG